METFVWNVKSCFLGKCHQSVYAELAQIVVKVSCSNTEFVVKTSSKGNIWIVRNDLRMKAELNEGETNLGYLSSNIIILLLMLISSFFLSSLLLLLD